MQIGARDVLTPITLVYFVFLTELFHKHQPTLLGGVYRAQEGIPGREEGQRGDGGDDEDVDDDGGGDGEYRSLRSNRFSEELKVPYARELFSGEETLLRGRSRREADQKRKLVLKK